MPDNEYLILKRHLDATPADVYRAWADPALLKTWWGPDKGDRNLIVDVDVRVGGNYHIVTQAPNGQQYDFSGEYREVQPDKRISFTWNTTGERVGSTVTAEIAADGDKTELTLTHQGLSTREERDGCKQGWQGALNKLERLVAEPAGSETVAR